MSTDPQKSAAHATGSNTNSGDSVLDPLFDDDAMHRAGTAPQRETSFTARRPADHEVHGMLQMLNLSQSLGVVVSDQGLVLGVSEPLHQLKAKDNSTQLPEDVISNSCFDDCRKFIEDNLTSCFAGITVSNSLSLADTNGVPRLCTINLSPYRDLDNNVIAGVLVLQLDEQADQAHLQDDDPFNETLTSRRFLRALDFFNGALALYDKDDRKLVFNQTYKDIHSFLGDSLKVGMTFSECVRYQLVNGIIKGMQGKEDEFLANRLERFHNPTGAFEVRKPDNKWYKVTEMRLEDGGCLQTMEDISGMKIAELALRESELRFKDFAETAADLFWELDNNLKFTYLSGHYEAITGDGSATAIGEDIRDVLAITDEPQGVSQLKTALQQQISFVDILVRRRDTHDNEHCYSFSGHPLFDENETFAGYRGIARDITEAQQLTNQLHFQARHDSLTGLMNRREFNRQISKVQKDSRTRNEKATLSFIDLDQFKIINDTEGHPAGDQLLRELATYLCDKVRDDDILARLGGDEFGLLLRDCSITDGQRIVSDLVESLRDFKFIYNQKVFGITASVGLVEINSDDVTLEDLMRQVDIACYAAKDLGRNQIHVYTQGDNEVRKRSNEILHASGIQQAIAQDQFVLFAQPIAVTQRAQGEQPVINHYEILLRMLDEDGNILLPASFIPVAERYRLMTDIDRWVIQKTCMALHRAPEQLRNTRFTINLSGESFSNTNLIADIKDAINDCGIEPSRIIFEITETAMVASVERACHFIDELTEFGCRFAIDDFGSGMSSFSYLKRFEAQFLKIDGSLIRDITREQDDRTMVAAINQMAHVLGMQTIAEFVEDEETVKILSDIGVDMVQGYKIGRPQPLKAII